MISCPHPWKRRMPLNGISLIFTVMAMLFLVNGCAGATMAGNNSGVPNENSIILSSNKDIIFNITSPLEDDVIYYDVVPAYLSVEGKIYGSDDIRNVTVTYGTESVECGKKQGSYIDVSCKFLFHDNVKRITVNAVDNHGSVISETRNFTSHAGLLPPGMVFVFGKVIDTNGNPVRDALLIFESETNHTVNTTTDTNGKYSTKKVYGLHQKITVKKPGYQTLVRDETFESYPYANVKNFTLSLQKNSVPGFSFTITFFAILVISLITHSSRKRRLI
jgi:hypothetical protein